MSASTKRTIPKVIMPGWMRNRVAVKRHDRPVKNSRKRFLDPAKSYRSPAQRSRRVDLAVSVAVVILLLLGVLWAGNLRWPHEDQPGARSPARSNATLIDRYVCLSTAVAN